MKKVSSGSSSPTKTASLLTETITCLQKIASKYDEFSIANQDGVGKIKHDYLKPKVKKLLKLVKKGRGTVLCIQLLMCC